MDDINNFQISFSNFDGPLDLLLSLIHKNKINIYDIPINFITSEYLNYINCLNSDITKIQVDFLVLATELIDIKVKMLLPKNDDDEDPRENLVEKLIVYNQIKIASASLSEFENNALNIYDREYDPSYFEEFNEELIFPNVKKLLDIFLKVIQDKNFEIKEFKKSYSLEDKYKTSDLIRYINNFIKEHNKTCFENLLTIKEKKFIISLFLAMLELVNQNKIDIFQDKNFENIRLERINERI